MARKSIKD